MRTDIHNMGALFIPTVLQIVIILGSSLISSFGYFRIIRTSFFIKIFTGLWLLCMGQQAWAVMVFFFVERFVETVSESKIATFNLLEQQMAPESSTKRFIPRMNVCFVCRSALFYTELVSQAYLCPGSHSNSSYNLRTRM